MDGFVDLEEAIKAETKNRLDRIEKLAIFSALAMLSAAAWLAWPTLSTGMSGDVITSDVTYAMIIIAWGIFVQDLGIMDKKSRSRIGTISTIGWLPLAVVAISELEGDLSSKVGMMILLIISFALFSTSRGILQGDIAVMKFRALMGFMGLVLAGSLLSTINFSNNSSYVQLGLCFVGLALILRDWFSEDNDRELRKKFDRRLNSMEERILILKSQASAVDQAASLIMTAREEGHRNPDWGMRLLDEAEEDIERSLSLAGDVDEIKSDSLEFVETAEKIAPIVKRPRKAWDMGQREVELGSLREGEALFRQAKQRANEIIEWWEKAEEAIREGSALLSSSKHQQNDLEELLSDAKKKLHAENPKKAYEFAAVIPNQVAASGDAMVAAENALKEAARQLKSADGINKKLLEERLDKAEIELEQGNHAQVKGLSDSVVREINAEREAMDDVRRALRQKVHLVTKWSNRDDANEWDSRLTEIEAATDSLEWTHAAALLERLTKDLDAESKASEEANELLEYVFSEWKVLRNQCEASGIKITDEDRKSTEEAIALADEAHKAGRFDEALESLGLADGFMERLRRRV
ncbi:MAG: hypothetical protein CMP75_02325 [Flavobacteriales bacterium]|nr:hypothetical protein [Flavobacteriales bacterium]